MNHFDETIVPLLVCPKTGKELLYDKKKILHTLIEKTSTKLKKVSRC